MIILRVVYIDMLAKYFNSQFVICEGQLAILKRVDFAFDLSQLRNKFGSNYSFFFILVQYIREF